MNEEDSASANMMKRWIGMISQSVPTVDLIDISALINPDGSLRRQTEPEYSQSAYLAALSKETKFGDYVH